MENSQFHDVHETLTIIFHQMQVQEFIMDCRKKKQEKQKANGKVHSMSNNICALDVIIAFLTFCSLSFNHLLQ
jgi:hypothetical protein